MTHPSQWQPPPTYAGVATAAAVGFLVGACLGVSLPPGSWLEVYVYACVLAFNAGLAWAVRIRVEQRRIAKRAACRSLANVTPIDRSRRAS